MHTEDEIVDLIERAADKDPFCTCGRHTTAIWRDGVVWLDCASLLDPPSGLLERFLSALTSPIHTHEPIIAVPAAA